MALDNFTFKPHGDVTISYTWASGEYTFENKDIQRPRKRVKAKKTYAFTIRYTAKRLQEFVDFFNNHHGELDPFFFTYDGVKEICYFSSAISPKVYLENKKIVAFECEVQLEVSSQKSSYSTASEQDILPAPRGVVTHSYDWYTQIVEMGASARRQTATSPKEKFSAEWSGSKKTRDKLIDLFNSHCKKPLILKHNGKDYKVIFPDTLEITDKREIQNIVGFTAQLDLEVV